MDSAQTPEPEKSLEELLTDAPEVKRKPKPINRAKFVDEGSDFYQPTGESSEFNSDDLEDKDLDDIL